MVDGVHCRTGSLEKQEALSRYRERVHCRTGSLEMVVHMGRNKPQVHCRTGSLETRDELIRNLEGVHCRTGSLKILVLLAFGIGQLTKRLRGIRNARHFRYALILLVFSAMR